MKRILNYTLFTLIVVMSFSSCSGPDAKQVQEKARRVFGVLPDRMPGAEKDTAELVALGKKLYFETKLSVNDTQSCNSCHLVDNNRAGVDNEKTSKGAKPGTLGDRNSPTVLNAGFHIAQFWDGRAKDLVEQAKGPILNPVEMAMPSEKAVTDKLSKDAEYKTMFAKAFPTEKNALTYVNIAKAIAAFERTLITKDRFDEFQKGDLKALSKKEMKGMETFIETGCTSCHSGNLLGGKTYQKMGSVNPYANTKDMGRFNVTKKDDDKFLFKTPSLRNIALTAPYFHDGAAATLEEAVTQMAWLQLGKKLEKDKVSEIVAFLKALSDKGRTGK